MTRELGDYSIQVSACASNCTKHQESVVRKRLLDWGHKCGTRKAATGLPMPMEECKSDADDATGSRTTTESFHHNLGSIEKK